MGLTFSVIDSIAWRGLHLNRANIVAALHKTEFKDFTSRETIKLMTKSKIDLHSIGFVEIRQKQFPKNLPLIDYSVTPDTRAGGLQYGTVWSPFKRSLGRMFYDNSSKTSRYWYGRTCWIGNRLQPLIQQYYCGMIGRKKYRWGSF